MIPMRSSTLGLAVEPIEAFGSTWVGLKLLEPVRVRDKESTIMVGRCRNSGRSAESGTGGSSEEPGGRDE